MSRQNDKVHKMLIEKANQVQTAADEISNKINDWQVIKAYMTRRLNEIELTEEQQRKLDRYYFIYNQQVKGKYSDLDIIAQLMNLPGGISRKQAYDDMACARELFNASIVINKQYEIKLELEIAKSMRRKCSEIGDFKTAAAVQKNITALMAMLPDEEENQGELFEGHQIEATFDPRLLGAPPVDMHSILSAVNAKRKVPIKTDLFEELETDNGNSETLQ